MTAVWHARAVAERLSHQLQGAVQNMHFELRGGVQDVTFVEFHVVGSEERDVFGAPTGESELVRRVECLVDSGEYVLRIAGPGMFELQHVRTGTRLRILDARGPQS
jgi:hypothetical protein